MNCPAVIHLKYLFKPFFNCSDPGNTLIKSEKKIQACLCKNVPSAGFKRKIITLRFTRGSINYSLQRQGNSLTPLSTWVRHIIIKTTLFTNLQTEFSSWHISRQILLQNSHPAEVYKWKLSNHITKIVYSMY